MKEKRAGLVCAGGVNRSFIARMPSVLASLTAVKAGSFRVARRIANSLRAGSPVEYYSALAGCDVIWIALGEPALDRTVRELAAETALAGRIVILCGTVRESSGVRALRTASLSAISPDERTLVAEGDAEAMRYLRRVANVEKRKLVEIRPGSQPLFIAGKHLATHIALPWIAAAVECLRAAGFSRIEATSVVEDLGTRTLKSYAKAGPKAWRRAAAAELRRGLEAKLPDPRFKNLYREGAARALDFFDR